MQLGKTAAFYFGSQVILSISGFIATFLIAYLLGSEGLGTYSVAMGIGFFWLAAPSQGVANSIEKRMSEGVEAQKYLGAGLVLNAALCLCVGALVPISASLVSNTFVADTEFGRILTQYNTEITLLFVVGTAYKTIIGALTGQKLVAMSGNVEVVERILRTLFQVGGLLLGLGVSALLFGPVFSAAVAVLIAAVVLNLRPTIPSAVHLRRTYEYAKYAWLGAIETQAFNWVDTIVLSFFVGSSLIGIYEAAWGIASMLAVASGAISQTLFPELSELDAAGESDRIIHYLNEGLAFNGVIAIPGLFGAGIIGERILQFYRPEFSQGWGILIILIASYMMNIYAHQFLNVINAIDRPDIAFRISAGFITLNGLLNVILIWQFGWFGAAFGTALSGGFRMVSSYWLLQHNLGELSIPYREVGHQIAAALVMTAGLWPVRGVIPGGRLWTLAIVLFGAILYGIALLTLSTRTRNKVRALSAELV